MANNPNDTEPRLWAMADGQHANPKLKTYEYSVPALRPSTSLEIIPSLAGAGVAISS